MQQQAEVLQISMVQEEITIIEFQTLDGPDYQIRINENTKRKFGQVKLLNNEERFVKIDDEAQKFKTTVYKNLQKFIDAHSSDDDNQNHEKLPQLSNKLQDIIEERDYLIFKSLKRKDLFDLACLAEFLVYKILADLVMKIILFHLAGKNKVEIDEWLNKE
ncbi:unnamed protein product (macronuclear) [Paramecium tetraurelia]|uniref:Uncharacterized protein n=1 Tax=Paramecium tetraurelia TaxID=5888 RepID=A0EAY9_PARTE|nr:uncharacterized protein GSPATT00025190001 [Paramecium tetraurelia]CAK92456.1 unnamed protein product [Paramecium tetraurelia]|eukprot:XP_001459853.1 hypothetical protein (macronuclear) [Paramecium tetraurelia strain d4-2]